MSKAINTIIGVGAGAAVVYTTYKLMQLKNTADNLETSLYKPRIKKVDGRGLHFSTNIAIKNPTNNTLKLSQPFVRLTSNGQLLASSNTGTEITNIKAKATSYLSKDIELILPWTSLLPYIQDIISLAMGFISTWKSGKNDELKKKLADITPLEMQYSTTVNDKLTYTSEAEKII